MLKRIRVQGFKSLVDVEVDFKPLSVFFGPNAAGKSNLLEALQLLARITSSRNLDEAWSPPFRGTPQESFNFGPDGPSQLPERVPARLSLEADVELSPGTIERVHQQIREAAEGKGSARRLPPMKERSLRYRAEIELLPRSGILRFVDESLVQLGSDGRPLARSPLLERAGSSIAADHSALSVPYYPLDRPYLVAMREELASWSFHSFEPKERMRHPGFAREARRVGPLGGDLFSYLNILQETDVRQFGAIERALAVLLPAVTGIRLETKESGELDLKLMEEEVPVPSALLSEGTLRILGLLAVLGSRQPPPLVGLEEPENGVHPSRLPEIAELLKSRVQLGGSQIIVTTHSPILLEYLPLDAILLFRKREGATQIRSLASLRQFAASDTVPEEELPLSDRLMMADFDD